MRYRLPLMEWKEPRMLQRRRFKQIQSREERLAEQALEMRERAGAMPEGVEKDALLKRARQADTAAHMSEWLASRTLQPPQ
ncbi:hypothetical protein [Bradyrhizobium jicamae]|nr:hypothetical protein [Bradyrhizobium jicamae]